MDYRRQRWDFSIVCCYKLWPRYQRWIWNRRQQSARLYITPKSTHCQYRPLPYTHSLMTNWICCSYKLDPEPLCILPIPPLPKLTEPSGLWSKRGFQVTSPNLITYAWGSGNIHSWSINISYHSFFSDNAGGAYFYTWIVILSSSVSNSILHI